MSLVTKRSSMTLFSKTTDHYSHRVRMVLAEKGVTFDVIDIDANKRNEDLAEVNPYHSVPTLLDRELVLYEANVIMEYLDERFPFPPLLPVDPIEKAEKRLLIYRFTRADGCWYALVNTILNGNKKEVDAARKTLNGNLLELLPLFAHKPYFKSDTMTLVDVCIAPILWRLDVLGISLGEKAKPIKDYANRLFEKEGFHDSLTFAEKDFN